MIPKLWNTILMKKKLSGKSKRHTSFSKRISLQSLSRLSLVRKIVIGVFAFFLLFNIYILIGNKNSSPEKKSIIPSEKLLLATTPDQPKPTIQSSSLSTKPSPTFTPTIKFATSTTTPTSSPNPTPTPIPCATSGSYKIQGTYVDSNNSPITIPGQKITITNKCTGESKSSESSPSWSFSDLPKADYRIVASQLEGYTVRSNNCNGCTFHPNFWGSNVTGNDFFLNPNVYYVDVGFQYWNNSQPTPVE